MDWIKLTVTTTNEASEAVINLLMENGAGGVEIDDSDLSQVELATYFQAQAGRATPRIRTKDRTIARILLRSRERNCQISRTR